MKEQKEIISGIYQIRNIKTEKLYIGSSIDIYKRFDQHKKSLIKGTHHSAKLQRSYNTTKDKSVFVFELVEIVNDTTVLKKREQYYIDKYDAFNTGYNCSALVDNPKYSEKNLKKAKKKKELANLYDEFRNLYDEKSVIIGGTFYNRIKDCHYSNVTIKRLIRAIIWFYENYDKNNYTMEIKYIFKDCWLRIYDKYNNRFALYLLGKDIFYSKDGTEHYIKILKDDGKYNPKIHIPVESKSIARQQ